ncbi:MAG TPA: ABC transporter permease, partial [Nitrolancea sp.]|nr:ABC transporter permease [Nitrolancea sp.]
MTIRQQVTPDVPTLTGVRGAPRTFWRDMSNSFLHDRAGMVGVIIIAIFLGVSVWGMVGTPSDTNRSRLGERLEHPSRAHILGTDGQGRDIKNRILLGAHLALAVGVISVAGGGIIGCTLGLLAGYYRKTVGTIIMRVVDALLAFPTLLLALAIMATLGAGLTNIMIAVGFSTLPRFARLMQAEVLSISEREYVTAAKAIGAPPIRSILLKHVLPNSLSSVLVMATLYVSTAILAEATLSFLGLGPAPPTPTWGSMINDGSSVLQL